MDQKDNHSFHIPVMGTGYTVDTPCKVAHLGISSVISIIDHRLTEQMREVYARKRGEEFKEIPESEPDSRAKRITAYLNMVGEVVKENFEKMKQSAFEAGAEISKYFELLPEKSTLKNEYLQMLQATGEKARYYQEQLRSKLRPGSIDVNIMTKLDNVNYDENRQPMAQEFNDAHAALRGFANSQLHSSLILSAGLNPRLFSYMATFDDFFPDKEGKIKKKIILKVSDYRSALIQGKFLAKKGLWVSEFRIESGLNCGGHAFASDGYLLGPILEEFKENKESLFKTLFDLLASTLKQENREIPTTVPATAVTVQGGVGTAAEHEFLLDYYKVDAVGWGTPFMLVPEVVNVDEKTLDLLSNADEDQLYLSHLSPLGVPFNTVKGSSAFEEIQSKVEAGKPGAKCIKKHLTFNKEYTDTPICTASIQYQNKKIRELQQQNHAPSVLKNKMKEVLEKMCLCVGLSNQVVIQNDLNPSKGIKGVAVCPGPNLAYFSKIVALREMVDHIYGRINLISRVDRPHMFIKELKMYIDFLREKMADTSDEMKESQMKYFNTFKDNLLDGIRYYFDLLEKFKGHFNQFSEDIQFQLKQLQHELEVMIMEYQPVAAGE